MKRHRNSHPDSRPLCFSHVQLSKFERRTCALSLRYVLVFFQLGFSGLLLLAEIFVATSLILHKNWVQRVMYAGFDRSQLALPLEISAPAAHPSIVADIFEWTSTAAGWITVASLALTVCVMVWNWAQANSVVKSDNIPQSFLSSSAFQLWTIKSYTHFCLLSDIQWGRSIRQRMVLSVYFGLQGFSALIVAVPRILVYACVVYAANNVPGMGTTALGFQQLGLSGYTGHDGMPLTVALGIMALSTFVHTLQLIRIMSAAIMCVFSLCYLGRIKRALARDIEFRIKSLVVSRCGDVYNKTSDSGIRSSHAVDMELRLEHTAQEIMSASNTAEQGGTVDEITEKAQVRDSKDSVPYCNELKRVDIHHRDLGRGVNANEEAIGRQRYSQSHNFHTDSIAAPLTCHSHKDGEVPVMPRNQRYASPYSEEYGMGSIAPAIGTLITRFSESSTIPIQGTTAMNGSAGASSYSARLPYGDRMATLSFYDDLLANISSERMVYTASLSNQNKASQLRPSHNTKESAKLDCSSSVLSLQSSALCSSMQLTYGSNNENDEQSILGKPVHPFDMADPPQTSTRLLPRSSTPLKEGPGTSINNTLIQPSNTMDANESFQMGFISGMHSQDDLQKQNTHTAQKRISRCSSSHSQDIIENWRIHVAPSPPTIPELYNDVHDTETEGASTPTGHHNGFSSENIVRDIYHQNNTGNPDRCGTIPIILSSHLQDARTNNCEEDQYFFSADDLEVPRPPYAYGQVRTQRQGSVNSSVGGYNYSTAASSPSLADSLSNPMYQQQSFGIMNSSAMLQPRPLPSRKGSLPSSLFSRPMTDDFRPIASGSPFHCQQRPYIDSLPAVPCEFGSNLSGQSNNMITLSGNTAGAQQSVDYIHTSVVREQVQLPSRHQRGHVRSQSQGARSSASSWDQVCIEDTNSSSTAFMDIPTITPSHMGYYSVQNDLVATHPALRSSGNMGLRETLAFNDESANYNQNATGLWPARGEGQQYSSSKVYRNGMSDNIVHPLDLSPMLLQTQSGSQREFHCPATDASNGAALRPEQAWDDTCVGLGLTFDMDHSSMHRDFQRHDDQSAMLASQTIPPRGSTPEAGALGYSDSSDNEGSIFIHYPYEQPVLASTASGLLAHTGQSDRASYSETCTSIEMTTATTSDIFDAAFMDYFRYSTCTPTPVKDENSVSGTMPSHDEHSPPTSTAINASAAIQSRRERPSHVQRQPSLRNKKNLIVNIVPL